jgi:acyl-coenzyme A synthetase/AMP-(fatty) acid ligase
VHSLFLCPACQGELNLLGDVDAGYQQCVDCGVAYPFLDGLYFFGEATINPYPTASRAELRSNLSAQLLGDVCAYKIFLENKSTRPTYDAYAAFQPFNESTRAVYSLFGEIKKHLRPGDPILDLWGRTGWSGEILASYFPDNPVYMIWEGDRNVLGYKGYNYWLREGKRCQNLHVVFSDIEKNLPFSDNFFGFIHGLDTFHRYSHNPLIAECIRVAKLSAPIVFPHIHLTNSEPDPYFDRGCLQLHGRIYRDYLDHISDRYDRQCYLLSEKTLFENQENTLLQDDWDMEHYNALLYIAPQGVVDTKINPCVWPCVDLSEQTQIVLNPLVKVDRLTGITLVDYEAMGGKGQEILDRHPLYHEWLLQLLPFQLSSVQRKIIFCVEQGLSVAAICELCDMTLPSLQEQLALLQEKEVCTFENISMSMGQLQRFYQTQLLIDADYERPEFNKLWLACAQEDDDWVAFISAAQDVEYTLEDVQEIVGRICARFVEAELVPGDRVLFCSNQHPEYLMAIWAAWLQGLVVVPVSSDWSAKSIEYAIGKTESKLIFLSGEKNLNDEFGENVIHFDALEESLLEDESSSAKLYFSEWLDDVESEFINTHPSESTDIATILFTSGTTGLPKGVAHSFSSLYRGSYKLSQHYQLSSHESLMSFGGFHSMSGLRNAAVLGLLNRQTLVLSDHQATNALSGLLDVSAAYRPNVIFSTPALIDSLTLIAGRLEADTFPGLSLWLCTGASVSNKKLYELGQQISVRFESYYGLTETGGFCTGTILTNNTESACIGFPVGAIFRCQRSESDINSSGRLEVFSDQLMKGYLSDDGYIDKSSLSDQGWYDTGDLVSHNGNGNIVLQGRNDDQFKTPAGDRINLSYMEAILKGQQTLIPFALIHNNNNIKIVIESAADTVSDEQVSELLNLLRIKSEAALGQIDVEYIEVLPVNSNGKIERQKLQKMF